MGYTLDETAWVMFRDGDKAGYVPARGFVVSRVIGRNNLLGEQAEYAVEVAPHIYQTYNAHEMFKTKEALFKHLESNVIDR